MPQVLITGANGFIGKHLLTHLSSNADWQAVAASRSNTACEDVEMRVISPGLSPEHWLKLVAGCDVIVHAAARAHVLKEVHQHPRTLYQQVNVTLTQHLAEAAIKSGVKRFIFISSAGVHGSESQSPFTEVDAPSPDTDYTRSKFEAEQLLRVMAEGTAMEVTILRLPLVYGPGVKGNFLSMLQALDRYIPLPLGAINNKRSLLYIDNLVDFIVRSLDHPRAANETFLLADSGSISTSALLRLLAEHLGSKAWIFSLPSWMLKVAALITNRRRQLDKLMASFEVDTAKAESLLEWRPPVTLHKGIESTVKAYRDKMSEGHIYD